MKDAEFPNEYPDVDIDYEIYQRLEHVGKDHAQDIVLIYYLVQALHRENTRAMYMRDVINELRTTIDLQKMAR